MNSPFPFTNTFLEKAVDHIRSTVLKDDFEELERLRSQIEAGYTAWAEGKLKGCPMFMRRYADGLNFKTLEYDQDYYNQKREVNHLIPCPGGVPMVPGVTENGHVAKIPGILTDVADLCAKWLVLKTRLDAVRVASTRPYDRGYYKDGLRYENRGDGKGYVLVGLPKYADILEPLVQQYGEDVSKDIEELIDGELPDIVLQTEETPEPVPTEEVADEPDREDFGEDEETEPETEEDAKPVQDTEPVPETLPEPETKTGEIPAKPVKAAGRKRKTEKPKDDPVQLEFCFKED